MVQMHKYILTIPEKFIILLIKTYKKYVSPLLPCACRFTPTCSEYMLQAIQLHGVLKGVYLGVKRLLRCHPWGKSGYDPVPPLSPKDKDTD